MQTMSAYALLKILNELTERIVSDNEFNNVSIAKDAWIYLSNNTNYKSFDVSVILTHALSCDVIY